MNENHDSSANMHSSNGDSSASTKPQAPKVTTVGKAITTGVLLGAVLTVVLFTGAYFGGLIHLPPSFTGGSATSSLAPIADLTASSTIWVSVLDTPDAKTQGLSIWEEGENILGRRENWFFPAYYAKDRMTGKDPSAFAINYEQAKVTVQGKEAFYDLSPIRPDGLRSIPLPAPQLPIDPKWPFYPISSLVRLTGLPLVQADGKQRRLEWDVANAADLPIEMVNGIVLFPPYVKQEDVTAEAWVSIGGNHDNRSPTKKVRVVVTDTPLGEGGAPMAEILFTLVAPSYVLEPGESVTLVTTWH